MRRLVQAVLVLSGLSAAQETPRDAAPAAPAAAVQALVDELAAPSRKRRLHPRFELLALGEGIRPVLEACTVPAGFEAASSLRYIQEHLPGRPETVSVPAGTYWVGSATREDGNPLRQVTLGEFRLDRTEVTCFEYQRFLAATAAAPPPDWPGGRYPYGEEQYPVRNVAATEAQAFAAWVGGRLPTADEWEVAAHLGKGLAFPWGESPPRYALQNARGLLVPVGSEPLDVSAVGCLDMVGSVSEWVLVDGVPAQRGGHYLSRTSFLRFTRAPQLVPAGERRQSVGIRVADRRP